MKWINNLKISQKILLFNSIAVFFILIVGYVGYHFTDKAAKDIEILYKNRMVAAEKILLFRNNLNAIKANVFELILSKNKLENQAINNDILRRRAENNESLKEYERTIDNEKQKALNEELKGFLVDYRAVQANTIDLALKNKKTEAYNYLQNNQDSFVNLNRITVAISKQAIQEAKALYEINARNSEMATNIIIAVILASIVLTISLGLFIASLITKPISQVVANLKEVSAGNLTVKDINIDSNDETGILGNELNRTVKNLLTLVGQVVKSIEEISAGTQQMSAAAEQTAEGSQHVATSVSQLAAGSQEQANNVSEGLESINKMGNVIQKISENADNMLKVAEQTDSEAKQGSEQASKAVNRINQIKNTAVKTSVTADELGALGSEIEQIVDLIKQIAGQTNLLALNAAIEAARAGEHGKGFAVVAEEVKKLAGQSADATDKITNMVKEIQSKTNNVVVEMQQGVKEIEDGVVIIENVGNSLKNILSAAENVKYQASEVSQVSISLVKDSDNIVRMMENISSVTEESAASSEEIASITQEQTASLQEINASSQSLAKVAENLQSKVSVFKI